MKTSLLTLLVVTAVLGAEARGVDRFFPESETSTIDWQNEIKQWFIDHNLGSEAVNEVRNAIVKWVADQKLGSEAVNEVQRAIVKWFTDHKLGSEADNEVKRAIMKWFTDHKLGSEAVNEVKRAILKFVADHKLGSEAANDIWGFVHYFLSERQKRSIDIPEFEPRILRTICPVLGFEPNQGLGANYVKHAFLGVDLDDDQRLSVAELKVFHKLLHVFQACVFAMSMPDYVEDYNPEKGPGRIYDPEMTSPEYPEDNWHYGSTPQPDMTGGDDTYDGYYTRRPGGGTEDVSDDYYRNIFFNKKK